MSIPRHLAGLVDDAAVFPPGLMPLADAVPAHAAHLASDHGSLVGPFVVSAADLERAAALVDPAEHPGGLRVSVVVASPAAIEEAVRQTETPALDLASLEVKLDLAAPLAPQIAAIAAAAPAGVTAYVEVPRPSHPEWPEVLREAGAHGLRLKLRTGGTEASAFPSEAEVATWIHDAVRADLAFKCTAGLHHAVRHTGPDTGFEHHGYLNILLATLAAADGADVAAIGAVLAERDGAALADALRSADPTRRKHARDRFVSYGSCSITEPLEDLGALHLLDTHPAAASTEQENR